MNNIISQWDKAAEQFEKEQERSKLAKSNKRIVTERFNKLNGEKVLDLGCGYGYYTNYFDRIGADAVGVDGSEAMIKIAQKKYPNGKFLIMDLTKPMPIESNSFDIVFCNQVLMDISNIEDVFKECYRILKTKGILYYSIVHPVFYNGTWQTNEYGFKYARTISSYIKQYVLQNNFWGETTHFHRTISDYLNAAANAGLFLINANEPSTYDGVLKNDDLPLFFFAEYLKPEE